ncbi:nicotinamide-nucleotide amidase [Stackebrandtia albiflava]|uniref:Nicotinamide-nucleotide amidase n=1 Tax=Stackebrandtia albiflava TaxID=406432 RepID=A0A562VH39_9ACTN|nr:CinA family protein [Stackebrandtia albiflava]TWJ17144.1 nicotinamide-nucleotide amidase [Stackebrandtia albiflava]
MNTTPAADVVTRLRDDDRSLAVAESLTGGLLAASLVEVPGSSAVFTAGVVAYTPHMKTRLLDVPAALIDTHGVVSAEVAAALAVGARRRGEADWGIGTTGAAGPEPHGGQPPGTVWLAVAGPDGEPVARGHHLPGDRAQVRNASVELALRLLLDVLAAERN